MNINRLRWKARLLLPKSVNKLIRHVSLTNPWYRYEEERLNELKREYQDGTQCKVCNYFTDKPWKARATGCYICDEARGFND